MTALPAPPPALRRAALVLALLIGASLLALPWNLEAVTSWSGFTDGLQRLGAYLAGFGAPDLGAAMLSRCLGLAVETVSVAVLGMALGLVLGYPLAMLASRCVMLGEDPRHPASRMLRRGTLEFARFLLDALRGVPDFLWAIVLANFTGVNAGTGMLAIGVSVAGILGKVLSEQWDNVEQSRYAALRSTGASQLAQFFYGVQPLAARSMQSFVLMRLECAVRNASVIGVVGGGGLGAALWDEYTDGNWSRVATVLLSLLAVTMCTDLGANLVRRQLRVDPNHPRAAQTVSRRDTARRRTFVTALIVLLIGGAVVALRDPLQRAWAELSRIEWGYAGDYVFKLLVPTLDDPAYAGHPFAERLADRFGSLLHHSVVPLALGVLSTVLGALVAALLVFPASVAFQLEAHRFTGERLSRWGATRRWTLLVGARLAALVLRGVPEVAWVVILMVFWKQGITPCVIAVGLHSAGVLHRVFTETVDNVPYQQLERVSNGCRPHVFLYGALPRALPDWRTYVFFQFEVNMRVGIALGIVGAGGLGERFKTNLSFLQFGAASSYLWAMILLTVVIDRTSRRLQMRRMKC
ncbi:MAG: ABC transporter permease subunit [Planctomycetes bacterium]|nr:ABC transporter permease subunit [Planctomycetota bacterium]